MIDTRKTRDALFLLLFQDAVQRLEGEVKMLEQKLRDRETNADTISRDNNLLKRKLDSLQASESSKRKNEALKLGKLIKKIKFSN